MKFATMVDISYSLSGLSAIGNRRDKFLFSVIGPAWIKGLASRTVIRSVDDVDDLRCNLAHHDLEALTQSHLRRRAPLTSAAHGDEQVPVAHVDDRDLPTVSGDGTIDLSIEEFFDDGTKFSIAALSDD